MGIQRAIEAIQACLINELIRVSDRPSRLMGIIGEQPSRYAKSPWLWNQTLEHLELDAVYLAFDVAVESLPRLMEILRGCEQYLGGSVTVPYKVAVMDFLDEVDPIAHAIRAVNTIVRTTEGRLVGYNTDGPGGIDSLTCCAPGQAAPFLPSLNGLKVVQIGAGGAGRAMAFSLANALGRGKFVVMNRTQEHAEALAADVSKKFRNARAAALHELPEVAASADLIVNCTVCGQGGLRDVGDGLVSTLEPYSPLMPAMPNPVPKGSTVLESCRAVVELSIDDILANQRRSLEFMLGVRADTCFFDLIYAPLETVMLAQARLTGHRTLNGKLMNIYQAVDAMFNKVCAAYFQEHGLGTEATKHRIQEIMEHAW